MGLILYRKKNPTYAFKIYNRNSLDDFTVYFSNCKEAIEVHQSQSLIIIKSAENSKTFCSIFYLVLKESFGIWFGDSVENLVKVCKKMDNSFPL